MTTNKVLSLKYFLFLLGLIIQCFGGVPRIGKFTTPLDDYVHAPDPTYSWKLNSTFQGFGYTAYNIDLISQTWMTSNESDSSVWRHWLTICVPEHITHHIAFMYIDGGGTHDGAPTSVDLLTEIICLNSRTVSAALLTIPNEPIVFKAEGKRRSEDEIIAYTWSHFINDTNHPIWLLRLPMTKAAVKAMDCIQEFVLTLPDVPTVDNFVVAGASKRGWTTWTTGAVDQRVIAMVPMVMPILNIVPNMNHQWRAYGNWSFALNDYLDMGLMRYLNQPVFQELGGVIDPWTYRDRLTMPKLILTAGGDEFFLPDSPQFFMSGLPGENLLTTIPDAEHSLATSLGEVGTNIATFYRLIITKTPRPVYTYTLIRSNTTASIIVNTTGGATPYEVKVWYAYSISNTMRDFRLVVCDKIPDCIRPVLWFSKPIDQISPGSFTYRADIPAPGSGWIAFLVELTYRYQFSSFEYGYLEISSEVNVVPDTLPYPPCGNSCQQ